MPGFTREDETFEVEDAHCIRESDKAILVKAPMFDEPEWIPKSCIHADSDVWSARDDENEGSLVVKYWLAEERGWL